MTYRSRAFTGAISDKPDSRDYHLDLSPFSTLIEYLPKFNMYKDRITIKQPDGSFSEVASPFRLHVFDQLDGTMTCVPCATGIAYKCLTERQKTADEGFIPSRLFLYYVYRLMHRDDLSHGYKGRNAETRSTWLVSLAANPPHMEDQIEDDNGSSPRDICRILKHLGCCQERSMYESGAGYPERDMWEPGWEPGAPGLIDGKPWWPYFEKADSVPKGRNLEPYFMDFWWKGYNHVSAKISEKDNDREEIWQFPSGSLGRKPPSSTAFASAKKHRVLSFSHPGRKDLEDKVPEWKVAIKHGWPVIFMFYANVTTYYQEPDTFRKEGWIARRLPANKEKDFEHCVLAVGWDDDKKCFKIQDSCGSEVYDNGFWWMPYEWLEGSNDTSMVDHGDVWILHE